MPRPLIAILCSLAGLGAGVWLLLICLLSAPPLLAGRVPWPLAVIAAVAFLGGWTFMRRWWLTSLYAGAPALVFCSGWFLVIGDEGVWHPLWPLLGALAVVGALLAAAGGAWLAQRRAQ